MNVLTGVLAYHSLATLVFSPMLIFAPEKLMKAGRKAEAKKNDAPTSVSKKPDKTATVMRFCGIWVFYGGLSSLYATGYFSPVPTELQVLVAGGLAFIHASEAVMKMMYTDSHMSNTHMAVLLTGAVLYTRNM
ncbi:hypothetical protein SARC_02922 [Sphaeroforma arctica JP610]|uniref:Uncharacterized protein n=1 Tax=Sphaeroforma arctica JP610 TaxID=667725 RepID=A0A0L0G9E4_9EUKA|nr:hypothetical protein SARC_02922 [Sphaeroforma arctica JP610]KNC84883.1 hypothetical protein SARC_02922 [Sphaeroforma arctica JP610]|eukprot:XP_014158785.1 hypothetical protein SARC_02922 [Sphaeroforma arctica JP610]